MLTTEHPIDLDNISFNALFTKAERGDAHAQYELAKYYENLSVYILKTRNEVDPSREDTTYQWYEQSAGQGHPDALYELGKIYENIDLDYERAIACYGEAAELQNHSAYYALGRMYQRGKGVCRDFEEAAKWYKKAADCGNALAPFSLEILCENGLAKATVQNESRIHERAQYAYQAHIQRHKDARQLIGNASSTNATPREKRRSS